MQTLSFQTQLLFRPLTPTQKDVDSTHPGAQPGLSSQDAGPAWRTAGVSYFKRLIFKDTLFYKQHTCNLLTCDIKGKHRVNGKSPELLTPFWLLHIYLFFLGYLNP